MTGDPAVEAAAVAMISGWDPFVYLATEYDDIPLADAIVARAYELRDEEFTRLALRIRGLIE